jgi:transposase
MTERVEQRYCIKFCHKLGDSKAEIIQKIQQAFGDDAMGATQIKEWINRFRDGRTLADSDQSSGRPSTSRNANVIENMCSLILEDRHLTIREIADEVWDQHGLCTLNCNGGFAHVQSGGEICAQAAFSGAATSLP